MSEEQTKIDALIERTTQLQTVVGTLIGGVQQLLQQQELILDTLKYHCAGDLAQAQIEQIRIEQQRQAQLREQIKKTGRTEAMNG